MRSRNAQFHSMGGSLGIRGGRCRVKLPLVGGAPTEAIRRHRDEPVRLRVGVHLAPVTGQITATERSLRSVAEWDYRPKCAPLHPRLSNGWRHRKHKRTNRCTRRNSPRWSGGTAVRRCGSCSHGVYRGIHCTSLALSRYHPDPHPLGPFRMALNPFPSVRLRRPVPSGFTM